MHCTEASTVETAKPLDAHGRTLQPPLVAALLRSMPNQDEKTVARAREVARLYYGDRIDVTEALRLMLG